MKRLIAIMFCLFLWIGTSFALDANQLISQKIDTYVLTQWRENRFEVVERMYQTVQNSTTIKPKRKKLFSKILEEDLSVYTQGNSEIFQLRWLTTNTAIHAIPLKEVLDGWPGKDWIPALSFPSFIPPQEAKEEGYVRESSEWIVVTAKQWTQARFYPFSILSRHEIVNDIVDDIPIAITYCPLCGTAISYDRRIWGSVVEFGVSWLLYESNLLMYDDSTESLWSQAFGEAVVWTYTDYELEYFPSQQMRFDQFIRLYPDGLVMSANTWYQRDYTLWSPYLGYDESDTLYFPVEWRDTSIEPKRLMIVVNDPRWFSAAFDRKDLLEKEFASLTISDRVTLTAYVQDDAIIVIEDGHNELPHFIEMRFSRSARNTWSDLWWNSEKVK